jgi:hypothetical protein
MGIEVERVRAVSPELVRAFGRLLPQLSSTARPLDEHALAALIACEADTVLIARADGDVVGPP